MGRMEKRGHNSNSQERRKKTTVCSSSRGVRLISEQGKIFTRVILNRIKQTIEKLLRENQSRFRKGLST